LIAKIAGKKWLVGFSEIRLTSTQKDYRFGGSFESIDHKKGNTGESWYVLNFRDIKTVLLPVIESTKTIVVTNVFVVFILAIVALLLGRHVARPLVVLTEQIGKIAKGDFGVRTESKRKDETGILARSFNSMAEELGHTTTSIKTLEDEVALRKKSEAEFSHGICPDCVKIYYPEMDLSGDSG
jgi:methyl-accepting chemotaxis protein